MTFRLKDDLLNCALYFYPDPASAERGERMGGSGFLLGCPIASMDNGVVSTWAVTNRHVIESGHWTIRVNTTDGGFDLLDTNDHEWFYHPGGDDLAVRPLALSQSRHQTSFITTDWLLTKEEVEKLDIGPGDPCVLVGRFINHEGRQKNTPTARFGQIAQAPHEPIIADGREQESYLVEIRSIGGYSGSPVFVYLDQQFRRDIPIGQLHGKTIATGVFPSGPWLLGVDWCMIPTWEPICDASGTQLPSGIISRGNTGMMGVVPAWRLAGLLESPAVVARREQIEAEALAGRIAAPPCAITPLA